MINKQSNLFARHGVSMRNLNLLMASVTILLSVFLLIATFRANSVYSQMRVDTVNYIKWQRDAYEMQNASDYLTEQARCFTETGDRSYLDRYFEEATVARRRENAVASIHSFLSESPALTALRAAMAESVALMEREYHAMRLTVEAYGYDAAAYPEEIRQYRLPAEETALSREKMDSLARSLMFDDQYHAEKELISQNMQDCLARLVDEIDTRQEATADRLQRVLTIQRVLIISTISITLFTMLLTLLLVISPLLRAVVFIRADEPIPVRGSNEFQFLAKTYNLMYEANREQKEQLAYDATHDPLTGIYNRSGYDFFLKNTDWSASALLLFDVDGFKKVNDTYGHEMGDILLKKVAESISACFRSQDYVCRIGGDEFAVIMVHVKNAEETMITDKVNRINDMLQRQSSIPDMHVSCGVAFGKADRNTEDLFRTADQALYRVKRAGGAGCEICR